MITGAAQMDGAILVVSAADGVMPQTASTSCCAPVNVPHVVVFLTKIDRRRRRAVELVRGGGQGLLNEYDFPGEETPIIKGRPERRWRRRRGGPESGLRAGRGARLLHPEPVRELDKPFLMRSRTSSRSPARHRRDRPRSSRASSTPAKRSKSSAHRRTTKTTSPGSRCSARSSTGSGRRQHRRLLRGTKREEIDARPGAVQPGSITRTRNSKPRSTALKRRRVAVTPRSSRATGLSSTSADDVTGDRQPPEGTEM